MQQLRPLQQFYRASWSRWLQRRIPAADQTQLSQRSIFVLPSRFGVTFLLLALAIYLLGTNYENNLVQLVSFLMLSMLFSAILHSFRNLSGLVVQALPTADGRVGESAGFAVKLSGSGRRCALRLQFPGQTPLRASMCDKPLMVEVPFLAEQRGRLKPGRICISSHYPLGLVRSWTYLDLNQATVIYPKPVTCHYQLQGTPLSEDQGEPASEQPGQDQFSHLKAYRVGESLRQVAWKQVAQGRGMVSKSFEREQTPDNWLGLASVDGTDLEMRLSQLAYAVETLGGAGQVFGLVLGGMQIPPGQGREHVRSCLRSLALYAPSSNRAPRPYPAEPIHGGDPGI